MKNMKETSRGGKKKESLRKRKKGSRKPEKRGKGLLKKLRKIHLQEACQKEWTDWEA